MIGMYFNSFSLVAALFSVLKKYLPYAYIMLKRKLLRFDVSLDICCIFVVASSLFEVSSDHIPIGRSFHFPLTFEVINLKNALEYSCSQLVQSDALKIVRLRDS